MREFAPRQVQSVAERGEARADVAQATAGRFTYRLELDFDQLESIVRREVALAAKLLRIQGADGRDDRRAIRDQPLARLLAISYRLSAGA